MLVAVMFLLGSFCCEFWFFYLHETIKFKYKRKIDESFIPDVTALQCYQCTSLNNTKCADPFSANDTFSECPPPPEHISQNYTEAQLCRKLKQTSEFALISI